jgi:rhodanese-related sulfurtransferase
VNLFPKIVFLCSKKTAKAMEDIRVQELKEKFEHKEDFVLIDVREPYEHQEFNVGGQLIPLATLPSYLDSLAEHKDKEIIIYCRSGNRSGIAKQLMERAGFTKVRNLLGGMLDWVDAFGPEG